MKSQKKLKEFYKKITFEKTALIIQTVILIGGFWIAIIELNNIQKVNSGNLALELYKDIRSDRVFNNNPKIIEAIATDQKILRVNGGKLEEEDLDNYLGFFDWISAANDAGIISDDMVYNFHGDLILNTYNNEEIKNYIEDIRKDDKRYYQGFLDLVKKVQLIEAEKVD